MEENIGLNLSDYSPLVLAYLGDAYYELLVRDHIISGGCMKPEELNRESKKYVTAVSQSLMVNRLLLLMSEKETAIYKAGRNAKSNHRPRSANVVEYRRATGLEALFGYLYLTKNYERALYLFNECIAESGENNGRLESKRTEGI